MNIALTFKKWVMFGVVGLIMAFISLPAYAYEFGETSSHIEEIIKTSRLRASKNPQDLEANLQTFQEMMLKQFFLKHLFSDEVSILDDEEEDGIGSFGMQEHQRSLLMDEFAKKLAEEDALGIKKQFMKELSSGTTTGRY